MGIRLPRAIVDEMVAHCLAERPHEACGILGAKDGEIVKVFRMINTAHSPVRYKVDDLEQLSVRNTLDENGWDLAAVYHSHTRTEAYPSPTDVREAREDVAYVIVSLAEDSPSIRAFRILKTNWYDDDGEVVEVPVSVVG